MTLLTVAMKVLARIIPTANTLKIAINFACVPFIYNVATAAKPTSSITLVISIILSSEIETGRCVEH